MAPVQRQTNQLSHAKKSEDASDEEDYGAQQAQNPAVGDTVQGQPQCPGYQGRYRGEQDVQYPAAQQSVAQLHQVHEEQQQRQQFPQRAQTPVGPP